jgi:hypothetical protein
MGKGACGRTASAFSAADVTAATAALGRRRSACAGGGGDSDRNETTGTPVAGSVSGIGSISWRDSQLYAPRPNAQPGAWLAVLRKDDCAGSSSSTPLTLHTMKWGLIPSYQKRPPLPGDHFKPGASNARCETVASGGTARLFGRKHW